jgi:hypothetical protein
MKNARWRGSAAAALLASALALAPASARLPGQDIEKICPITFGLYPGTTLESSCAARVEKDNVRLSAFLSALRMDEALDRYRAEFRDILADKRLTPADRDMRLMDIRPLLKTWIEARFGHLKNNPFLGTYLESPVLTTETGIVVEGLEAVVGELARIVMASTYVDAQSVRVELEYLPYGSDGFRAAQVKYPPAKAGDPPVDMIAHIATVLAYAPKDAPPRIAGLLPHRTVCFDI